MTGLGAIRCGGVVAKFASCCCVAVRAARRSAMAVRFDCCCVLFASWRAPNSAERVASMLANVSSWPVICAAA